MSLPVFISPPSIAWNSTKTQKWNTKIQKYGSGKRKTLARWSYPEWEINCSYTCLDNSEIEYVAGFFAMVKGQFKPFLWRDLEDYQQKNVRIGIGDGETTGFQLVRSFFNYYVEPVRDIVPGTLTVFVNDQPFNVTLEEDGWIEFNTAPSSGAIITANFEYYWRVAFSDDELDSINFWYNFYKLNRVKLVTVK